MDPQILSSKIKWTDKRIQFNAQRGVASSPRPTLRRGWARDVEGGEVPVANSKWNLHNPMVECEMQIVARRQLQKGVWNWKSAQQEHEEKTGKGVQSVEICTLQARKVENENC